MPPPASYNGFSLLKGVTTSAAIGTVDQLANIRENLKLRHPMMYNLPGFNKVKGSDKKIALVGGGPSLKNTIHELKDYKTIISCGSVHDYLITNGIIPTYATNCDPSYVSAEYFRKSDTEVMYLIGTNSDKAVFKVLDGKQIAVWHCHSEEQEQELVKIEAEYGRNYQGVGGGCTVGLRSISIALTLGYSNLHFFGFDSCMGDDGVTHHAYDWQTEGEESSIDQVYKIQLGSKEGPNGKNFYVAGYQLAQLENFKQFYTAHYGYFVPTFHGGGALSAYVDLIKSTTEYKEPTDEQSSVNERSELNEQ